MKRLILLALIILSIAPHVFAAATVFPWTSIEGDNLKNWSYRMVIANTDVVSVTTEIISTTRPIQSPVLPIPIDTQSISVSVRSGTSVIGYATSFAGTVSSVTIAIGVFPNHRMAEQYKTVNTTNVLYAPFAYKIPVSDSGLNYIDVTGGTFTKYGTYDLPIVGTAARALVIVASPVTTVTSAHMTQLGNEGLTFEVFFNRKR